MADALSELGKTGLRGSLISDVRSCGPSLEPEPDNAGEG
jgi:hypothetical protein